MHCGRRDAGSQVSLTGESCCLCRCQSLQFQVKAKDLKSSLVFLSMIDNTSVITLSASPWIFSPMEWLGKVHCLCYSTPTTKQTQNLNVIPGIMEWLRILFGFFFFHLFWMEEAISVSQWDRLGKCTSIEKLVEMSNAIAGCCLTFKLLISLFISGRYHEENIGFSPSWTKNTM